MTALHRRLRKCFEKAVRDYNMWHDGERLLVAVSGGADSLTLLTLLCGPKVDVPDDVQVVAAHLDLGFDVPHGEKSVRDGNDLQKGDSAENDHHDIEREEQLRLERYFQSLGCEYIIERTGIGPRAHQPGNRKNPCFLCSRQRRKRLFEIAEQKGCRTLVLGHHRDDIVETFLLNVFYSREISTMVPRQKVFSGQYRIVRPLAYIEEGLIKKFAEESGLPVLTDRCPTSGGSYRTKIKQMLDRLEREDRHVRDNIFKALGNVKPEYLLLRSDRPS
jgi:tRNA 2-thiocytidine biosynthesis protein TtcA